MLTLINQSTQRLIKSKIGVLNLTEELVNVFEPGK